MYKLITVLAFLLSSFSALAQDFATVFSDFLEDKRTVSNAVQDEAQNYHYVFVSGFLSEQTPRYWVDNTHALTKLGVPKSSITILDPPSGNTTEENSLWLGVQLANLKTEKPFVVFAHSKGSVETLLFAVKNVDFMRTRVKAAFLIQGAYTGTPIADALFKEELKVDRLSRMTRTALTIEFYVRLFALRKFKNGLKAVTTQFAQDVLKAQKHLASGIKAELEEKIFFITSSKAPEKMSRFLKNAGEYLSVYFEEKNDGLVLLSQQSSNLAGRTIAVLDGDHSDFSVGSPISKRSKAFRFSFMQSLLTWLIE